MDRGAALALTVVIGGIVALQAPINSTLGRTVGNIPAAVISLTVAALAMVLLLALTRSSLGELGRARELPWFYLVGGGFIGASYVGSVLITVRSLGAGGVTAATIAGQLAVAVLIDHFGWLGVEEDRIDVPKLLGIVLLAAGTYLVVRD